MFSGLPGCVVALLYCEYVTSVKLTKLGWLGGEIDHESTSPFYLTCWEAFAWGLDLGLGDWGLGGLL